MLCPSAVVYEYEETVGVCISVQVHAALKSEHRQMFLAAIEEDRA